MPPEKLIFAQAVDALFVRSLGPHLTREGRVRLKEVGLDLSEPLRPAYSVEQWKSFLRVAAPDVFPGVTQEVAYRALGERHHQGLRQTAVGRASMALVTKLGPRRSLERMAHHVRAGNNFNEVRMEEVGDTHATLWLKEVTADNPYFACGFLLEALRMSGASCAGVEPVAFDGTSATFRLTWVARGASGLLGASVATG
jgi:uncharacterized protein (TIGR02265 family)